jgi:hypothetical protein
MAAHDVQVIFQGATGLSRDRFVNTLHFDGDFGTSQMDELWTQFRAFGDTWLGSMAGGTVHEIRSYAPGLNPTGPELRKNYALTSANASGGPGEVALCLSYGTEDDPDSTVPRGRGRIYLGPFVSTAVSANRPSTGLQNALLTLGEGIASVGFAANTTWVMRSQRDASYKKIESIWVDDSWDTQRRRGLTPTIKTKRDVQ